MKPFLPEGEAEPSYLRPRSDAGQSLLPLTSLNPYSAVLSTPQALGPVPMWVILSGREGLGKKSETV